MPHVPLAQLSVLLGRLQTLPQVPQCEGEVSVFTSQPVDPRPSQFPKPGAHVPSVQVPLTQLSEAEARSQTSPQPPQSVSEASVLVSQPLEASASQLSNPLSHAPSMQRPDEQDSAAWSSAQSAPHMPQ